MKFLSPDTIHPIFRQLCELADQIQLPLGFFVELLESGRQISYALGTIKPTDQDHGPLYSLVTGEPSKNDATQNWSVAAQVTVPWGHRQLNVAVSFFGAPTATDFPILGNQLLAATIAWLITENGHWLVSDPENISVWIRDHIACKKFIEQTTGITATQRNRSWMFEIETKRPIAVHIWPIQNE